MKKYTTDSPEFSKTIDIYETTDPAHADLLNQVAKEIFENTLVLNNAIAHDALKGSLQEQIDDISENVEKCFQSVSDGKKLVANAITDKGITTSIDAEFATMAINIGKIKSTPNLQSKSAVLDTGTTSVTMKPDVGYDGLDQATAKIVLQEKSVTLGTSAQSIIPDSGKLLSKVIVPAVPGNAALTHVLTGKTFSSETSGVGKTGTMANKAGTTVKASATSQDDDNTYLTIPVAGYYDEKSKVFTENSNLILNSSFDCARMYYSRYYKTKQGYEINLKTGEYAIISLFNGGRGASTMPTIVDCTKVLETSSTFGSTTSTSDGGIVYLQVYQANSNSASITSDANWWNVGCLVVDKNTGNKLFNNYKAVYSYRNTKTSQNVSYNESIRKDNYIIVPTLVGGREGYICPEITNCDLVLCTPLITGNLTSSSDGGITGIEIYKARDNASIVGTASWWNTTAIITY